MKPNILIVLDYGSEINKEMWMKYIKMYLCDYDASKIKFLEGTPNPTFTWSTEKKEGISEAFGDPDTIIKNLSGVEVLVVGFAPVTKRVIDAGKDLKLICVTRGTPFNVDIEAATARGLPVMYIKGRNAISVAEHTIGLMIAEARHIARCHEAMRNKTIGIVRERWRQTINELYGKKLGIIGFGSIGKEVAIRAKAFGMNIIVYDPYVSEEDVKNLGGSKVDLETLLKEADFITLHAKLTPETYHLISAREINLMKKTAILINTSRGAIVDEQALYEALKARRIAGAALDVYEQEPFSLDNPILQLDNVTVTPHLAGTSSEVPMRTVELAVKKIADFISGKKLSPTDIVNPSILKD